MKDGVEKKEREEKKRREEESRERKWSGEVFFFKPKEGKEKVINGWGLTSGPPIQKLQAPSMAALNQLLLPSSSSTKRHKSLDLQRPTITPSLP